MSGLNNSHQKYNEEFTHDYTGAVAEALFMANLLFIGIFYLILWGFYFIAYKNASLISKNHIKQTLVASSTSTAIVIVLVIIAMTRTGFASLQALIMAEVYLMVVVPIFMLLGILGFTKAINEKDYRYPVIGKFLRIPKTGK